MPSLTLRSSGAERLTISRHFPGWLDLGITPNGLIWAVGSMWGGSGPAIRPKAHSFPRYSSTIAGLFRADSMFLREERSGCLRLKPILKPLAIPDRIKSESRWCCRAFPHALAINGVRISVMVPGRVVALFERHLSSCKRSWVYWLASEVG